MENRENSIFGRKIFFINPPMGFDVSVIKKLRDNEFEAYEIKNVKYIKSILRKNENALCFINIDSNLSVNEWYNFIKSFKVDETLKSIFIGVMSGYANTGERGKFLMNLQLPGGFVQLNQPSDKLIEQLSGILLINGAKGRRQYIRLGCKERNDINGYMTVGSNLFAFKIENVSVVGFACTYNKREMGIFQKNTVHKGISITLGKKSIVCPSVVFDTRLMNDQGFSVMLFTNECPNQNRQVIKNYIFSVLDEEFLNIEKLAMPDYTDYTVKITIDGETPEYEIPPEEPVKKIGDVAIPKPDDKKEDEELNDLDEVEELDDDEEI